MTRPTWKPLLLHTPNSGRIVMPDGFMSIAQKSHRSLLGTDCLPSIRSVSSLNSAVCCRTD
jgi:hypothetical protein